MIRRPPRATGTYTLFHNTTLFRSDGAIKITTARYDTPSGRSIQAEGIIPDVPIQSLKIAKADDGDTPAFEPITEADLKGSLVNKDDKTTKEELEKAQAEREKQRSEEHTSELQSLMRISYAVFC